MIRFHKIHKMTYGLVIVAILTALLVPSTVSAQDSETSRTVQAGNFLMAGGGATSYTFNVYGAVVSADYVIVDLPPMFAFGAGASGYALFAQATTFWSVGVHGIAYLLLGPSVDIYVRLGAAYGSTSASVQIGTSSLALALL